MQAGHVIAGKSTRLLAQDHNSEVMLQVSCRLQVRGSLGNPDILQQILIFLIYDIYFPHYAQVENGGVGDESSGKQRNYCCDEAV